MRTPFRLNHRQRLCVCSSAVALLLSCAISQATLGQRNFTRAHAEHILEIIKGDIQKNYYDPQFHGIDLDARFKAARDKLKTTESGSQMMAIIAQALLDFDDSHLFFIPPGRSSQSDYGWEMQSVADPVYISAVKPKSDAEAKGLKEGDLVVSVGGFEPTRDNLWKIQYLFNGLSPKLSMHLVVKSPDGKQREMDVMAKVKTGKTVMDLTGADIGEYQRKLEAQEHDSRSRWVTFGEDLFVWKLPTFAVEESSINAMIGRAKKFKTIVLDLRGNGGGYVSTCERLTGAFFDKEFVIAEPKGRKKMKVMKSQHAGSVYAGKLIVLIDSGSASASEIFARAIQIEKRGTIIGDRSAGAVMEALDYPHELGMDTIIPYAVSVTEADVIMADGKSLEKVGVVPDELILPSPDDMRNKRDPVMARAAVLGGVQLAPEKAGSLFPIEWRK